MKYYRIRTYSPENGKYASSKVLAINETETISDYTETCEQSDELRKKNTKNNITVIIHFNQLHYRAGLRLRHRR